MNFVTVKAPTSRVAAAQESLQFRNAAFRIVAAGNFPPATCGMVTAHWLVIYPPNQTTPVYLKYSSPTCSKQVQILTVNVVQPGSGGST